MDLIGSFLFYSFLLFLFYKPTQNGNRCYFIVFKAKAVHDIHGKLPRQIRRSIEGAILSNQKSISESITFVIFVPFRQIGVLSLW